MRLSVVFESEKAISLPISYSYQLQSAIYEALSSSIPTSHDFELTSKGRGFKPFVFSRLISEKKTMSNANGTIKFYSPIKLRFASPLENYAQAFANGLLKRGGIGLFGFKLELLAIETALKRTVTNSVLARTISPVTVYSTLKTEDGKKKTYFYNPAEKDFQTQIEENLSRKAEALELENYEKSFAFKLLSRPKQRIVKYKDFVQIAWDFNFQLNADPQLISLALDWGLGSKNAQGFGMIEVLDREVK